MNCKLVTLLLFVLCDLTNGNSQPVAGSRQVIGDIEVYQDFKKSNLYYYAPGNLRLSLEQNGKPEFQLLEMRYTGSSAYGDSGDKRFLNMVQFGVSMEQVSADALKSVRQYLGEGAIDLRPLPVSAIDAFLVAPVGDENEKGAYKKLGKDGSFQAEGEEGASGKYGFWTERTFTLKLENHEAQLLWDQVANGLLSLSLGYTFYAEMLPGRKSDVKVSGDRKLAENFESATEELLTIDTVAVVQVVKADAFAIRVDVAMWPGVLKRIDINEGIPPGYAALEVRCFDFANDLRPDLAVKGIDIAATGVGGQTVTLATQKFLRAEPDLFARQIRFPYAVKLTQPYRYRIVEYTVDGSKVVSQWKVVESWAAHLDITTPDRENTFLNKEIDIEVPLEEFADKSVGKVDIRMAYTLAGRRHISVVSFQHDEKLPIKQVRFKCDKKDPVTYEVVWTFTDGTTQNTSGDQLAEDNYLYIIVPDR